MALRVLHAPVNFAGIPATNSRALRAKGVDSKLVVFSATPFRKDEPDVNLNIAGKNQLLRQLIQWKTFAGSLPRTDIFHFYFGLTLVPQRFQFPLLEAARKGSVFHYLGSDIRRKTPEQLAFGKRADAQIVGSYDAIRWVPEAEVVPPGIELDRFEPVPPADHKRPVVLHAPSRKRDKGTDEVLAACEKLPVDLEVVHGLSNREAMERYKAADIVIDQLNAGWYGVFAIEAMTLGKPVMTFLHDEAVARTNEAFGVEVPIVSVTKQSLEQRLGDLVEAGPPEWQRLGAASRAYVEQVHDSAKVADRLLEIYGRLGD